MAYKAGLLLTRSSLIQVFVHHGFCTSSRAHHPRFKAFCPRMDSPTIDRCRPSRARLVSARCKTACQGACQKHQSVGPRKGGPGAQRVRKLFSLPYSCSFRSTAGQRPPRDSSRSPRTSPSHLAHPDRPWITRWSACRVVKSSTR